jgi:hypothetical protein
MQSASCCLLAWLILQTMKMETVYSTETSRSPRAMRQYNSEDCNPSRTNLTQLLESYAPDVKVLPLQFRYLESESDISFVLYAWVCHSP